MYWFERVSTQWNTWFIDYNPTSIKTEDVAERIARAIRDFQIHECRFGSCHKKVMSVVDAVKKKIRPPADWSNMTYEEKMRLSECSKHFPKPVYNTTDPKAHVTVDFNHNVTYHPPRDNGWVNNYHPVIAHLWGANTDYQVIHKGMCNISAILS
jgi:hypothetical protein